MMLPVKIDYEAMVEEEGWEEEEGGSPFPFSVRNN